MRYISFYSFCCFIAFSSLALGNTENPQMTQETPSKQKLSPYIKRVYKLINLGSLKELKIYLERPEVQRTPEIQELLGSLYHEGVMVL